MKNNPIAQYEPIIRDEARKFCRRNRFVEVEDAEQEARLGLLLKMKRLAEAENRGDAFGLARDIVSVRLLDAFLDRVREVGPDGKVVTTYVTPPDRDGSHDSFESMGEALDAAMDADDGEAVSVEAEDLDVLSTPSHEDEVVNRVTLGELRGIIDPMLDENAAPDTLKHRRARLLPDVRKLLKIEAEAA